MDQICVGPNLDILTLSSSPARASLIHQDLLSEASSRGLLQYALTLGYSELFPLALEGFSVSFLTWLVLFILIQLRYCLLLEVFTDPWAYLQDSPVYSLNTMHFSHQDCCHPTL